MFRTTIQPLATSLVSLLLALLLSGCILSPPVYSPSGRRSPDNLTVRGESKVALFTLLLRKVNVSRSNGLAWISRRDAANYQDYKGRINRMLRERLNFRLVAQEELLDTEAYLAGRFPVREKFFLNPDLLPIVRKEEDQDLMLRLGRALKADYFVTALVDHEISKTIFFAPRVKARVELNLYGYYGGFIGNFEQNASLKVSCPEPSELPANRACAPAIDAALDRATAAAFDRLHEELRNVQVREKGASRLREEKPPPGSDENLGKFPKPKKKKRFKYIRR